MLNHNFDKQFRLQKRYKATSKKKEKKTRKEKKILRLFLKETFRDRKLVDYIRMSWPAHF